MPRSWSVLGDERDCEKGESAVEISSKFSTALFSIVLCSNKLETVRLSKIIQLVRLRQLLQQLLGLHCAVVGEPGYCDEKPHAQAQP